MKPVVEAQENTAFDGFEIDSSAAVDLKPLLSPLAGCEVQQSGLKENVWSY